MRGKIGEIEVAEVAEVAAGAETPVVAVVKARVAAVVVPTSKSKIPLHSRRSVASEHITPHFCRLYHRTSACSVS